MSLLSPQSIQRIDHEIAKYPADQKRSAVMSALRIAQEQHGWLPRELMYFLAPFLWNI